MKSKGILTQIDELRELVSGWEAGSTPSSLEMDLALERVKKIYELIRFPSIAEVEEEQVEEEQAVVEQEETAEEVEEQIIVEEEEPAEEVEEHVEEIIEEQIIVEEEEPAEEAEEPIEEPAPAITLNDDPFEFEEEIVLICSEPEVESENEPEPEITIEIEEEKEEEPAVEEEPAKEEATEPKLELELDLNIEPTPASDNVRQTRQERRRKILSLYGDESSDEEQSAEPKPQTKSRPIQQAPTYPPIPPTPLKQRPSLKESLGVNDRFLLANDLFGGDSDALYATIAKLDMAPSLDDALLYIARNYRWRGDSEGAKLLSSLLQSRFS